MPFDAGLRAAPNAADHPRTPKHDTRATNHRHVYSARLRADITTLHNRGLVPLAIADKLGVSVTTVSRILREQGVALAAYLTTIGPRRTPRQCPHCGKRLTEVL